MIPSLMRLGVENVLKIICEKIIIKNIQIDNKHNKFNGIIEQLHIKAENIIFNKIYISNINIFVKDLVLRFAFDKKFLINNCYAVVHLKLTTDNINKTLLNDKRKKLKNSIESFISKSFQRVEIINKSIRFISSDASSDKNIYYTLQHNKNSISLVNNINQEKLSLLNDRNIIVNNLYFSESNIELDLSSKVIFS